MLPKQILYKDKIFVRKAVGIHLLEQVNSGKLDNTAQNHELYDIIAAMRKRDSSIIIEQVNPQTFLLELDDEYVLVNDRSKSVDYYVKYKTFDLFGKKVLFQSLVWSDRRKPWTGAYKGYPTFAAYIFYSILFPKSDMVICSDKEQSRAGKAFWERRLSEAFANNLFVYIISTKEGGQVVSRINNLDELVEATPHVWGKDRHHLRLVISKQLLAP